MEEITTEHIQKRAYYLSLQQKSREDLIWLLAETELKLQTGSQPSIEQVRSLAEMIAQNKTTLDQLHWFLAEKQLLFERKQAWKKF